MTGALPGGRPRAAGWLERRLREGLWVWALVHVLLLVVVTLWVVTRGPVAGPLEGLRLWLACFGSLGPLPWLGLLAAWPGRPGVALRAAVFLAAWLGLAWLVASGELWLEQDRPLLFDEIAFRLADPPSRPLFLETLRSPRMLLFAASLVALGGVLRALLAPLGRRAAGLVLLGLLNVALVSGLVFPLVSSPGDFREKALCAPWTFGRRYLAPTAAPGETVLEENPEGARAVRRGVAPPFWAPGPEPALAPLAGRYRGRNVVLVLLESHRLADVAPFGEGAHGYRPRSPFMTRLAERSLSFTNYVATGPNTFFAQFSVATGLPGVPGLRTGGVRGGGSYARLGRFPDLRAEGYRCEWLQATPISFDSWDRYLLAAGVPGWIRPGETDGFDRSFWTSLGMPDEQLYELAWRRLRQATGEGTPYLLAVLTVSNHLPFRYPAIPELAGLSGHEAGTRYADHCLETFVERLLGLPEEQRPVVFVTADHGHRFGLEDARPLGPYNLEGIRLPGFLVTPDGRGAGARCGALFNHEDALDLIHLLVGAGEPPGSRKFLDFHRVAAATVSDVATSVLTGDGFVFGPTGDTYRVRDLWQLESGIEEERRTRLLAARRAVAEQLGRIWTRRGALGPP